jgi:FAD:protein FMN transferase
VPQVAVEAFARCQWLALGTDVVLATTDPDQIDRARMLVVDALESVDVAYSRFRSDSELSRVNAQAGNDVRISPLLCEVIAAALDAAAFTDGLVDPTVGSSVIAAGYNATFVKIPSDGPEVTLELRPVPGWQNVELNRTTCQLRTPPDVQLDLGAVGKAWVADRAAGMVADLTGSGVLVSCGGDVAVRGEPPDGGWPVEVSEIGPSQGHTETVMVSTGGLATSGTSARRWRRGEVTLHHIIDPRTGVPAETPWVAVSATGAHCVEANTAATAAIVLGHGAPEWLEARGIPARLVANDGAVVRTGGWPE